MWGTQMTFGARRGAERLELHIFDAEKRGSKLRRRVIGEKW